MFAGITSIPSQPLIAVSSIAVCIMSANWILKESVREAKASAEDKEVEQLAEMQMQAEIQAARAETDPVLEKNLARAIRRVKVADEQYKQSVQFLEKLQSVQSLAGISSHVLVACTSCRTEFAAYSARYHVCKGCQRLLG